jgi:hypothetical protein
LFRAEYYSSVSAPFFLYNVPTTEKRKKIIQIGKENIPIGRIKGLREAEKQI